LDKGKKTNTGVVDVKGILGCAEITSDHCPGNKLKLLKGERKSDRNASTDEKLTTKTNRTD